ncbi:unnamed protein product [Camellia sinensis]
MTNGNNSGKHAFHSDIPDKDIVEALENEVQYWADFSKVHYHPLCINLVCMEYKLCINF